MLAAILKSMKEYDISPEEVSQAFANAAIEAQTAPLAKSVKSDRPRKPVAAKYRNPATGALWTGRGKAPLWILEAEKSGQSRQLFLI